MTADETWSYHLTRSIAAQVRHYRKARKWSAQRLSDECGKLGMEIPRSVIADLENGRRQSISVAELLALAWVLGVSPMDLVCPLDLGARAWKRAVAMTEAPAATTSTTTAAGCEASSR